MVLQGQTHYHISSCWHWQAIIYTLLGRQHYTVEVKNCISINNHKRVVVLLHFRHFLDLTPLLMLQIKR